MNDSTNKQGPQVPVNVAQQSGQMSEQIKGMADRAGLSGTAVLDANPGTGLIRLKIELTPRERQAEFITSYANMLAMTLSSMNLEVMKHVGD